MKIITKDFYYISHAHDTLTLGTHIHAVTNGAHPILWNNKGLCCVISRQKVQNVLDLIRDKENLPQLNTKEVGTFRWEDGVLITAKAAAMLLS